MGDEGLPINAIELSQRRLDDLDPRIEVPRYDRAHLLPGIVHIGVGSFHRSHLAAYLDDLCNDGLRDWSITGAGVMARDAEMAKVLSAQDGLYTLVTRSRQNITARVIGTIVSYGHAAPQLDALIEALAAPSTRLVSLTITEGGYPVDERTGRAKDAGSNPAFRAIAEALNRRRERGDAPFTVMSCDNILHNGNVTRTATLGSADDIDCDLASWIEREVPFPCTMVDRITPATTDEDRALLANEYGLIDRWPVVAEPFRQWVIEDTFAQGRPPWEDAGALLTDDVEPYEILKLRLLNAGHSCIAYLAALAGFERVDEVMADNDFGLYLRRFLDQEAGPVLPVVPGVDVEEYKAQVIERFSNPAIRDRVSRLCQDGSSKIPIFLLPTIEAQLEKGGRVDFSALALAGWCQYLLGSDDRGRTLRIAHDPRKEIAIEHARSSLDDSAAFLGFSEVFDRSLASDPRLLDAFQRALGSLRSIGARATLAEWVSRNH